MRTSSGRFPRLGGALLPLAFRGAFPRPVRRFARAPPQPRLKIGRNRRGSRAPPRGRSTNHDAKTRRNAAIALGKLTGTERSGTRSCMDARTASSMLQLLRRAAGAQLAFLAFEDRVGGQLHDFIAGDPTRVGDVDRNRLPVRHRPPRRGSRGDSNS